MRLSSEDYHHRLAAAMRTNGSAHVPTDRIIRSVLCMPVKQEMTHGFGSQRLRSFCWLWCWKKRLIGSRRVRIRLCLEIHCKHTTGDTSQAQESHGNTS